MLIGGLKKTTITLSQQVPDLSEAPRLYTAMLGGDMFKSTPTMWSKYSVNNQTLTEC
jgi:hypothetical protein